MLVSIILSRSNYRNLTGSDRGIDARASLFSPLYYLSVEKILFETAINSAIASVRKPAEPGFMQNAISRLT